MKKKLYNFCNLPPPPPNKPILIVCFSKSRSLKLAKSLAQNSHFCQIYPYDIYYLDVPIMELDANFFVSYEEEIKLNPIIEQTKIILKEKFLNSKKAWIVTFSGGKDSTCVLSLVYEMLANLPKHKRKKTFAISSNTLVEAPHIDRFLKETINSINQHAKENDIPFEVIGVSPSLKDDFWVNLIGKGYPSPTRTFRWCTERLKINPAKAEVAKITAKYGSCILLLGSRKSESINRKKSIEKRILNDDGYSLHHDFPDTLTYSPIAEWDTDTVWSYLLSHKPLWKKDYSELFELYTKASADECQFITDLAQSSCGGSRFGCWVCTVVNEDKSMQGFIKTGETHLQPLNDFRNFIKNLREDPSSRADYNRNGRAVYKNGKLGPFLSGVRVQILEKLLETEALFKKNGGENLISDMQILAIQEEWDKDFDFNKSAIALAKKFQHLKEHKMAKNRILHKEILENFEKHYLGVQDYEDIILSAMDIECNFSTKGRNNASERVKDEIKKMLNNKSAKEVENVYN